MKLQFSLAILFALLLAAFSPPARADGLVLNLSDHWACSPVGAITGYQLNLKTTTFQKGVALGAGYGCRYDGWKVPLGISGLVGASLNENSPNAGQGNILFTVYDNYGVAIGGQVYKDPTDGSLVPQALVSFVLTASAAATIKQFETAKKAAASRAVEAARAASAPTSPGPTATVDGYKINLKTSTVIKSLDPGMDFRAIPSSALSIPSGKTVDSDFVVVEHRQTPPAKAELVTYPDVAPKSGGMQVSNQEVR